MGNYISYFLRLKFYILAINRMLLLQIVFKKQAPDDRLHNDLLLLIYNISRAFVHDVRHIIQGFTNIF